MPNTFNHIGEYVCECGKKFNNSQSFNAHKGNCKIHLEIKGNLENVLEKRREGQKKRKETLQKITEEKHKQKDAEDKKLLEFWISEQHKCERCGKVMTEYFGSGRFCSYSCANSRIYTDEQRKNISRGIKTYFSTKETKNNKICKICGTVNCCNDFCRDGNKTAQIKTLIKYFGFDQDCVGTENVFKEWDRVRDNLYKLYWIDKKSTSEIAKMYNYPSPCNLSGKVFKYLKIDSKSCRESANENLLEGRWALGTISTKFKREWHTTWDGNLVYLRSSYETDYANYLDENKIHYEVESLRIKYFDSQMNKDRISIPDFYIPNENLIVEIKSCYTLNIQNMIDRAEEYLKLGYKFKLIIDYQEKDINYLYNLLSYM